MPDLGHGAVGNERGPAGGARAVRGRGLKGGGRGRGGDGGGRGRGRQQDGDDRGRGGQDDGSLNRQAAQDGNNNTGKGKKQETVIILPLFSCNYLNHS
jgi:hypothetical protein